MTQLLLIPVFGALLTQVLAQSNYASQGNSIEYSPGLPPSTVLDGKVTKLDDISPVIFLNRTEAHLNCGQGSMEIELRFHEPFYGVAYADFDRNSACMVRGNGANTSQLELPLKGVYSVHVASNRNGYSHKNPSHSMFILPQVVVRDRTPNEYSPITSWYVFIQDSKWTVTKLSPLSADILLR